jgi:hypothetical protein
MGWTTLTLGDQSVTMADAKVVMVTYLTIDYARRHPDDYAADAHPYLDRWFRYLASSAVGCFDLRLEHHLSDAASRMRFARLLRAARSDLARFGDVIEGRHLISILHDPAKRFSFLDIVTPSVDEAFDTLLGLVDHRLGTP